MLATAESCTGGLIAATLTEIAGSSDVFERGFVTYSNDAKSQSIGVPAEIVAGHGAVSEPVARAMAERSEEHTSELQSLMRISYAVFCLKKKNRSKKLLQMHHSDVYLPKRESPTYLANAHE